MQQGWLTSRHTNRRIHMRHSQGLPPPVPGRRVLEISRDFRRFRKIAHDDAGKKCTPPLSPRLAAVARPLTPFQHANLDIVRAPWPSEPSSQPPRPPTSYLGPRKVTRGSPCAVTARPWARCSGPSLRVGAGKLLFVANRPEKSQLLVKLRKACWMLHARVHRQPPCRRRAALPLAQTS